MLGQKRKERREIHEEAKRTKIENGKKKRDEETKKSIEIKMRKRKKERKKIKRR